MRSALMCWVTLVFSLVISRTNLAQAKFTTWDQYKGAYPRQDQAGAIVHYHRRMQHLQVTHQHLEVVTRQLNTEIQTLFAMRQYADAQLHEVLERAPPRICKCESADTSVTTTPLLAATTPKRSDRPEADNFAGNTTTPERADSSETGNFAGNSTTRIPPWELESLTSKSAASDPIPEDISSSKSGSFFTSSAFVVVVLLVVAPAAVFTGVVIICKRPGRRHQHSAV